MKKFFGFFSSLQNDTQKVCHLLLNKADNFHRIISYYKQNTFFLFILSIIAVFIFGNIFSFAQENIPQKDSVRKNFPEVKVTAKRILSNTLAEFSPNSIIGKKELEQTASTNLSEALIYAPGLFIKDYGGLGGMKTVSVRGTSSNQTLVMLNGIRLNSSQNGMTDLSNLPLSMIGNVEVVRSGFSAAYGGNAVGGCINILPDLKQNDKYEINSSIGSFNEQFLSLNAAKKYSALNLNTAIEYKHSDGNYPISFNNFGNNVTVNRNNADFTNYSAAINGSYNQKNFDINTFLLFYNSVRGVPGAVLQGHIESLHARFKEHGTLISVSSNLYNSKNWNFKTGLTAKFTGINFNDKNSPGIDGKPLNNDFNSMDYNYSAILNNYGENRNFGLNFETFYSSLKGDMLQPDIDGNPKRYGLALSINNDQKFSMFDFAETVVATALRMDIFNDNSPAYSPFAGIIINPNDTKLNIKLNASNNFRMPGFNELYYLNYGTANLKPEKSTSLNFGMNYTYENIFVEINSFLINTDDLIVSVPRSPVSWSAQNIGKALNTGIEVILTYSLFDDKIKFDANYTLQKSEDRTEGSLNFGKQLVYVPQEMLNLNAAFLFWDIIAAVNFNYTSFRYSLVSNDISSVMPEYFTLNVKISKVFEWDGLKMKLNFAVDNLTDEKFSVVRNYPMPGMIFRLGIGLGYLD